VITLSKLVRKGNQYYHEYDIINGHGKPRVKELGNKDLNTIGSNWHDKNPGGRTEQPYEATKDWIVHHRTKSGKLDMISDYKKGKIWVAAKPAPKKQRDNPFDIGGYIKKLW
jgi:hypothetical protein